MTVMVETMATNGQEWPEAVAEGSQLNPKARSRQGKRDCKDF